MKQILALSLAMLMLVLSGCGAPQATPAPAVSATPTPAEPVELVVFAAASMTEAMEEIAALYKTVAPHVNILYNFESSGTLKTQIEQGADCDIFISAGQRQMNELDISADAAVNTAGLDFVLQGSRFNIVSNTVVLVVPQGSDKGIATFEDVMTDKVSLLALGNSDVPVGQYAEEIYTNLGLWADLQTSGKVTYGSNVKEVLTQVAAASVDCGVVYSTDAATATGVEVAAAAPEGSHRPITYPAAIMNTTAHQAEAEAFSAFLQSDACSAAFADIGFTIPAR
jgi:molybdenum ABC transporter, periplasmic molybdate-binding protein